jgi:uncharacterized protein (DUF433 family)
MRWRDRTSTDPNVCHDQACIKGTRTTVSVVLDNLAAGLPKDEITQSYPALTKDGIREAMAYAAELAPEQIVELPGLDTA